jgi:hypothetical protein
MLAQVNDALADVYEAHQSDGRNPSGTDPRAVAGALVSMLAHVAQHRYGFEFWGIRTADIRTTMARHLYWGLTAQKPPA